MYAGNAGRDRDPFQWLIGGFLPPDHPLYQEAVEIKWQNARKGDCRLEWVTGETATCVSFLIRGYWRLEFRDKVVELKEEGDFALWGPGEDHRWEAVENSFVVTVRWPSKVKGGKSVKTSS